MDEQRIAQLISELDRARRRLYALLRSADARVLSKRPASGDWSIIEHVRHLVFAEQAHLGEFLPDGSAWSPMSLTQRSRRALPVKGGVVVLRRDGRQLVPEYAGTEPKPGLEEVLRAWDLIHRPIRKAVKADGADAHDVLERHIRHLLRHIGVIEKLLRKSSR